MSEGQISKEPQTPEPETVRDVFQSHHKHFLDVSGEVSIQQLETEHGIKRQYSGRLLYELLQNALDSSDSKILVKLANIDCLGSNHALVVANDGDALTVDPEYDYQNPPERREARRPDFNALCSIRTSNKSADDSVGNKGIGFRSVFAVGEYARVWSQYREASGWWGIELHLPIDGTTWKQRLTDPDVRRGHESILESADVEIEANDGRPSFHFPLPLQSNGQPESIPNPGTYTTAVIVPVESEYLGNLQKSFTEMQENHLYFLGLFEDRQDITVQFEDNESSFERSTWPELDSNATHSVAHWSTVDLEDEARMADLDISEPGAAVAWPNRHTVEEDSTESTQARIYGYLPTKLESAFGVDIHGDFQLRTDRTGLQLGDEVIGSYNQVLLQISAEIHLVSVLEHLGLSTKRIEWEHVDPEDIGSAGESPKNETLREDFWQLLDPGTANSNAADEVVEHVQSLLFTSDHGESKSRYRLWAEFAKQYFEEGSSFSQQTYRDFWQASKHWVDQICEYTDNSKTWRVMVTALCDAVRETEALVVPVTSTQGPEDGRLKAVPLPERGSSSNGGNQRRHSRAVFVRNTDKEALPLPEALRRADRAVTSFQFPSSIVVKTPQPLGTRDFNRWQVLSELRQIPNRVSSTNFQRDWNPEPLGADREQACELQRGLIRFAADLYLYESRGGTDPTNKEEFCLGWRTLDTAAIGKNTRKAGRAIATLYLPSGEEMWEPARQLTRDRVDESRLGSLPENLDIDSFLSFLGVGPPQDDGPQLTLIEGGSQGRVPPRKIPPQLENAGQGNVANVSLGILPNTERDTATPEDWRGAISNAWGDWLGRLVNAEQEIRARENGDEEPRSNLIEPLSHRAWYPVDNDSSGATSPIVADETDAAIEPRSITLQSLRQNRFKRILWDVDSELSDSEFLTAFGAIEGIGRDVLSRNNSEPAFRLLQQLCSENLLEAVSKDRVARQALIELFGRILESIVATDHDTHELGALHLLSYKPDQSAAKFNSNKSAAALDDRILDWKSLDQKGWIVTGSSDRETMRRFFPEEPLVAGDIGRENLQEYDPLEDRCVTIEGIVNRTPLSKDVDDQSGDVEEEIRLVVPKLLALAEAELQIDMDTVSILDNWRKRRFEHVDNCWVEYRAILGDTQTKEHRWLKDTLGNALYQDSETPKIFFDTADDEESVPLAEFGEPLTALLFEEPRKDVGSLFARALSEFDSPDSERRLNRLITKADAAPLVDSYERRFRPLDEEEEAQLRAKTEAALEKIGLRLSKQAQDGPYDPKLGPSEVKYLENPDRAADVTQKKIERTLRSIELPESQTAYAPQFNCESEYYREWQTWFEDHHNRLIPFLRHLCETNEYTDLNADDVERQLDEFITTTAISKLSFEPESAVLDWLKDEKELPAKSIPSDDKLIKKMHEFSPRYKPVSELPSARSEDRVWCRQDSVDSPDSGGTERGTFDESEAIERMRRQGAVGDDAEVAFKHIVAEQTASCLNDAQSDNKYDQVREMLLRPFKTEGETATNLRQGLNEWEQSGRVGDLGDGLHISQVWDGAGFDLLGIERRESEYELVRYEVKALPGSGTKAKVHLSKKQFAVYRDVCRKPDTEIKKRHLGDWKLVGVDPDGNAEDLTTDLLELPDLLGNLRSAGFGHDGIVLHVSRNLENPIS